MALYKEVLEYYEAGLAIPDDVTLMFPDDNFGNIRRLPTDAERKRTGGLGVSATVFFSFFSLVIDKYDSYTITSNTSAVHVDTNGSTRTPVSVHVLLILASLL